jgi:hypothetical protein
MSSSRGKETSAFAPSSAMNGSQLSTFGNVGKHFLHIKKCLEIAPNAKNSVKFVAEMVGF